MTKAEGCVRLTTGTKRNMAITIPDWNPLAATP
jgi:hypothetical protein